MTRPRHEWLEMARKLDWTFSYVSPEEVYPPALAGTPWLPHEAWAAWDEPYKTTFHEYARGQAEKEAAVEAVRESVGRADHFKKLHAPWLSAVKLHAATLPLAEFAAVIGNLRASRFARDGAWRQAALFGALDELRHTQIPLQIMHELLTWDPQFDWTHRFYHTDNWIAIAARHCFDELLLGANPIEMAIGTNFVFETGFTNLQFVGLSSLGQLTEDHMFTRMVTSIQTDEARHAQIGRPVLEVVKKHDPEYVQYLLDKWFWRSWRLFSIVTGFAMDYFAPLTSRRNSFKEFMQEWILEQYLASLEELGMKKPWYWTEFEQSLDYYHHMVYASAYTYRATTWFDFVVPSPEERRWLKRKYPGAWPDLEPVWDQIVQRWEASDPGTEWGVHGTTPVGFCSLCQLVLCGGTPRGNTARTREIGGRNYIFCSDPCAWIFENDRARYAEHLDIVKRILTGAAPANLVELLRKTFGLDQSEWGRDVCRGRYDWLDRRAGPG